MKYDFFGIDIVADRLGQMALYIKIARGALRLSPFKVPIIPEKMVQGNAVLEQDSYILRKFAERGAPGEIVRGKSPWPAEWAFFLQDGPKKFHS